MRSQAEIEQKLVALELRREKALRSRDNAEGTERRHWDVVADQITCQMVALKWVLKYEWIKF